MADCRLQPWPIFTCFLRAGERAQSNKKWSGRPCSFHEKWGRWKILQKLAGEHEHARPKSWRIRKQKDDCKGGKAGSRPASVGLHTYRRCPDSWCDIRAHKVQIKWCILIVYRVTFVMVNPAFSEMNVWDNWVNLQPSLICRLLLRNCLASWHCLERKAAFWATCKFHAKNDNLRQARQTFLIGILGIISMTGRLPLILRFVSWSWFLALEKKGWHFHAATWRTWSSDTCESMSQWSMTLGPCDNHVWHIASWKCTPFGTETSCSGRSSCDAKSLVGNNERTELWSDTTIYFFMMCTLC